MYQAGLVLEGGGMKGVYTSGVLDFFLDKDIEFSNCYGVQDAAYPAEDFYHKVDILDIIHGIHHTFVEQSVRIYGKKAQLSGKIAAAPDDTACADEAALTQCSSKCRKAMLVSSGFSSGNSLA